jgi:hypothetical protein
MFRLLENRSRGGWVFWVCHRANGNTNQRGEPAEKLQHRPAPKLASDDELALRADTVNLKNSLRQIEPDPRDSRHILGGLAQGWLPFRWGS